MVAPSARSRIAASRSRTAARMPRPRTVSPPARICSVSWNAWAEACPASCCSRDVRAWFTSASTRSSTPANTASRPSIQWNRNSTARKIGVQGASKNAKGPGPDAKRCIASRSASPVAGAERASGEPPARVRIAPRTRGSIRAWNRAPARASTRALK